MPSRIEAVEAEMPSEAKAVAAHLFAGAGSAGQNGFKLRLVERVLGAVPAEARS